MAILILDGECGRVAACLVDTVTDTVFGPLFRDREEASLFLDHATAQNVDVRRIADAALLDLFVAFRKIEHPGCNACSTYTGGAKLCARCLDDEAYDARIQAELASHP